LNASDNRDAGAAWAFLAPTMTLMTLFMLGPVLVALVVSLLKMDVISGHAQWAGLKNLDYLLEDEKFWAALRNTVRYVLVVVPAQTVLALGLACLLNGKVRFRRGFVMLLFLPTLTSSAAMTMIFMWLFNNDGLITQYLQVHWGVTVRFLSDPAWALLVIMLMNVFSTVPLFMVVFLAGLQDIPAALYEAMKLDGAGPLRKHWEISVSQLTPILFYVVTMGLIGCFQVFDQAFIVSGGDGGPENSTLTFTLLIYHFAFKTYNTMGLACMLALVLTLIIVAATALVNRFFKADGVNR